MRQSARRGHMQIGRRLAGVTKTTTTGRAAWRKQGPMVRAREAMEAVKQQATARPPITGGATQLEKIDLSECPDVRARAIGAIARNCPDLKDLTLVGCVSVGDEAC